LKTWNISADAVVFIDDSPMEMAEVAQAHPGITCLEFPRGNYEKALVLFHRLRELFGKHHIGAEDAYRLESIRQAAEFQELSGDRGSASEELLASLNAQVTLELDSTAGDARALELVNKTNQFNLNGIRYTEADWQKNLNQPGSFLATVSYKDKFGPLGKIAVVQGRVESRELRIQTWVMSCRAFSRRIEQQCLATLLDQFEAQAAVLEYVPTSKNGPVREFLESVLERKPEEQPVRIERALFEQRLPRLYHSLQINKAEYGVHG
jgi:FkbH-like protein